MAGISASTDLNLIEELWLRRWARHHYTDPQHRVPNWHPVILDEMRQKDHEQREASRRVGELAG